MLNPDTTGIHYRGHPFVEPGVHAFDDQTCSLDDILEISGYVDTSLYGSYYINYQVEDAAGNPAVAIRQVDIVLPVEDLYSIFWDAHDTCTTGTYFYTGKTQDCDCDAFAVTVSNISDFGASATFTLPVSGQYNQEIVLDTAKSGVYFNGLGTMSRNADTIYWDYTIQDTIDTDVCRSVWVKD